MYSLFYHSLICSWLAGFFVLVISFFSGRRFYSPCALRSLFHFPCTALSLFSSLSLPLQFPVDQLLLGIAPPPLMPTRLRILPSFEICYPLLIQPFSPLDTCGTRAPIIFFDPSPRSVPFLFPFSPVTTIRRPRLGFLLNSTLLTQDAHPISPSFL